MCGGYIMKNSFGFRLAGLSLCLFLFGTTVSAAQYQIPPNILALIQAHQQAQALSTPAPQATTSSCAAPACVPCIPGVCPQFSNLDWGNATWEGAKKAL